jgi:hypothetical protein
LYLPFNYDQTKFNQVSVFEDLTTTIPYLKESVILSVSKDLDVPEEDATYMHYGYFPVAPDLIDSNERGEIWECLLTAGHKKLYPDGLFDYSGFEYIRLYFYLVIRKDRNHIEFSSLQFKLVNVEKPISIAYLNYSNRGENLFLYKLKLQMLNALLEKGYTNDGKLLSDRFSVLEKEFLPIIFNPSYERGTL